MDKSFYINNRKKLFNKIDNNSALILFSGDAPVKNGDSLYDFFVDRNFYYMTGIDRKRMFFAAVKSMGRERCILYIPRDNGHMARWVGANMTPFEAKEASGISDIRFIDEFEDDFAVFCNKNKIKSVYIDTENRFNRDYSIEIVFAEKVRSSYPSVEIKEAFGVLSSLREIKEPEEIELMKKAISITKDGIYSMMKNAKAGMREYELEAYFDFELKKNGVKAPAFNTIAAGGKNATVLHYEENNCAVNDNEMILFDLGASYGKYSADITRTFPINGRFTDEQKDFYNMVLDGQKLIIDMIKPGIDFASLNETLRKYYVTEMKKRGFVKDDSDLNEYYFHSVSHHLGLETHDVGDRNGVLKEGMIITVEPGIYITEKGIGIRIEDDVLVTKDGCEVLSADIIKEADDIERFMSGGLDERK